MSAIDLFQAKKELANKDKHLCLKLILSLENKQQVRRITFEKQDY